MPNKGWKFPWEKPSELSGPDLLRLCGEKLTDRDLWRQFEDRFRGLIFTYVMRALRLHSIRDDIADVVPDLTQEVYVRLVQNDGRTLRSYKGTTEFSVRAFLATISASVVKDHQKHMGREKRSGHVIPIDRAKLAELNTRRSADAPAPDLELSNSRLSPIDLEREIQGDADRKNARRNALIIQLHYKYGFEAREIAKFPGFQLTESGVQAILTRFRKRFE